MKKMALLLGVLVMSLPVNVQAQTEGFVERGDGARIHYTVQGEGPALLLIHGYPLNGGLFRDNVAAFAANYQVIVPDLRGFGQSTTPSQEASIQLYARDMLAVPMCRRQSWRECLWEA
jgi:alpha-beta hydrolase superfamily lysophospholipase